MGLSVNIICQNEDETLPYTLRCVQTLLPVLDNVVVVDGGSTDSTLDVIFDHIKLLPLDIVKHPFDACGWQKNRGLDRCRGEWVLDLDADTTFTSNLAEVFASGYFEQADAWNFGAYFTVVDPYHVFAFRNLCGPSLKLFRSSFRYMRGYHQDIDSPRQCTDVVHVFENSHLQTQSKLLERGVRWQVYNRQVAEVGPSMGEPWRYLEAEFWGRSHHVPLPAEVARLVVPRDTDQLKAIDLVRMLEPLQAQGVIPEWVRQQV